MPIFLTRSAIRRGTGMGLVRAFDNRSLRTKIGTAVLIATAGGLVTGVLARVTLHGQNVDAAASQRKTIAVEAAASAFSKNVESLLGALANIQLYPQAADVINQGMAANKKAISDSLATLSTELKDDPTGVATVAKAQTDWTAFLGWMTQSRSIRTPAELTKRSEGRRVGKEWRSRR